MYGLFERTKKEKIEDKEIIADLESPKSFERKELVRVYAVNQVFTNVSFKQAVINSCYFRKCTFTRCDFTGANIRDSNFQGATFRDCNFRYSTWDSSLLDGGFLKDCLPSEKILPEI